MKTSIKSIVALSIIAIPTVLLANIALPSALSYCVNDYPLVAYILFNEKDFAKKVVYSCVKKNQFAEGLVEDVQKNFSYTVDHSKLPNVSSLLKGSATRPSNSWNPDLLEGSYFSEVFGQCSKPKQCALVKYNVSRSDRGGAEGYVHFMVLTRNSSGKFEKTHESFAESGTKG
jgi:hypothetical protein